MALRNDINNAFLMGGILLGILLNIMIYRNVVASSLLHFAWFVLGKKHVSMNNDIGTTELVVSRAKNI